MTATGGDRIRHRVLRASVLRLVIAGAIMFSCGFSVAEADETIGRLEPSLTTPTTPHPSTVVASGPVKASAQKPRRSDLAKAIPYAPPPKPVVLTALESLAVPSRATYDLIASLDRGEAKIVATGSASTPPYSEGPSSSVLLTVPVRSAPARAATVRPAPSVALPKKPIRVGFTPGASDLPEAAAPTIDEIATLMSKEPGLRLQLLAFATATTENASQSRRLSLHRALAVRGALIEAGVRSTRIDVRALGSQTDETPTDRVDILVVPHGGS